MYWIVNVSKNNIYFFRTDKLNISKKHAKSVFLELKRRFPRSEGYEVSVSKWESYGTKEESFDGDQNDN
jgi:hypothetical protein